jgi:Tfp pilus assembly protein PilN
MAQNITLYAGGRKRRLLFSRAGVFALVVLAIATVAVFWVLDTRRRDALRSATRDAERAAAHLEQRVAAAPKAAQRLEAELDAAEAEVTALEAVASRLGSGALGRTTGFTRPLRALARGNTEGVWLTGVHLDNRGGQIALEGKALDAARVPAFIERLRRAPQFAGTDFASIEIRPAEEAGSHAPASLVRFRLATAVPTEASGDRR